MDYYTFTSLAGEIEIYLVIRLKEDCERDFCLRSNIMGLNGALIVVLTAQKNTFEKLNSNVSF